MISPICCHIQPHLGIDVLSASITVAPTPPRILSVPPLSLRPAFTICFDSSPFCLSSFSPHLPVFCAPSTLPPAFSVLVQPRPLFPLCLPFPLWCCPLTPHPVIPPNPPADGDPKSSCSSLDCSPFKFFWVANNCCQQAPHKIPAWLLLWGLQWHTGSNGH